jgi:SAM-dependent methyltransferase
MSNYRLDLGCGNCKKEGTLGIDIEPLDSVDYLLNLEQEPLPFPDKSVEYIHSSHFFEHIENHVSLFQEISRVCQNRATLEIWTPYAWHNEAFVFGHKFYFTEDLYLHLCYKYPEIWQKSLKARWILKEIVYIVHPDTILDLFQNGIPLEYAIKYCVNIVKEIGIFIEIIHDEQVNDVDLAPPLKSFALKRNLNKCLLKNSQINRQRNLIYKILLSIALIKNMGFKNFLDFLKNILNNKISI